MPDDVDPTVSSPEREGLAGTTSSELYARPGVSEDYTKPPDGRPLEQQPQWRKDFPIDWPHDQYVARRDFAKFLVLTSASFAVGQAWIAGKKVLRPDETFPRVRIARLGDIELGASLEFSYPHEHDRCILVRLASGEVVAYSQLCTHLSCAVVPDVESGLLRCPCHEGFFDVATGRNLAGPPPRPLARIELAIENGEVFATGVDERTV
jgi:Rieske Fe-S protein